MPNILRSQKDEAEKEVRKNFILAAMPSEALARLKPHLSDVDLPLGTSLFEAGKKIEYCYFLDRGLASMVVTMQDGTMVEAGLAGFEGVIGATALMGVDRLQQRGFIQIAGMGQRIRTEKLREEYERNSDLRKRVNLFAHAQYLQAAQGVACNRLHEVEQRMSRWLLMCHDRMNGDELRLTHEFIATMLGARRPTVTLAAGLLQQAGIISYSRGLVQVLDRRALEESSCECYKIVADEYQRLEILSPASKTNGHARAIGPRVAQDPTAIRT